MNVPIPAEFEEFVESVVRSGEYADPSAVVGEALQLLKKRERLRQEVAAGLEQLDRGEYTEFDDRSADRFVADVRATEHERFSE